MDDVDEVAEIAPEPVKLPHDECVAIAQSLEAGLETGAVIELAARGVAIEIALGDACSDEIRMTT